MHNNHAIYTRPGSQIAESSTGEKTKKKPIAWAKDCQTIDEDGTKGWSSYQVLLDWICTGDNYQRWRGDSSGATNTALARKIVEEMKNKDKIYHRNVKDVLQQLEILERKFAEAEDFRKSTGQGILDEYGEGVGEQKHMGRCYITGG